MLRDVTMLIRRWNPSNPGSHSDSIFKILTSGTKTDKFSCLAITMYNLASPKWIKVGCNSNITTAVVCMKEQNITNQSVPVPQLQEVFKKSCVIFNMSCYLFEWNPKAKHLLLKALRPLDITSFEVLFRAMYKPFPPIYLPNKNKLITYKKYGYKFYYREEKVTKQSQFYTISKEKTYQFNIGGNLFKCSNGVYISIYFVCDQHVDCKGDTPTDELECECNSTEIYSQKCKYIVKNNVKKYCSFFYSQIENLTCGMYTQLKTIGKLSIIPEKEVYENQISCGGINQNNFTVSNVCTFKINESKALIPCAQGEHLETCEEFECNMMFKCPNHYCIPWNYVCDGKWDCPQGYDEITTSTCNRERICPNMFKCRKTNVCIHLGDVCDDVKHCPHEDDEKSCLLSQVMCPSVCQCLSFVIKCNEIIGNINTEHDHLPFHVVKIINSSKIFTFNFLQKIYLFSILIVKHSNLDQLCFLFTEPQSWLILHVGYNRIVSIHHNCFHEAPNMHTINISHNKVSHISDKTFWNLYSLKQLDISYNPLTKLSSNMIGNTDCLFFIYLKGIEINLADTDVFKHLKLKILHTNDYKMCCLVRSETKCTSKKPWYFSCQNLLGTMSIKICYYCISFSIIILNIISFILQIISKINSAKVIIMSITVVDFTYGIYVTILLAADKYFSDNFFIDELKWRSSSSCFISLSLAINFSLLSPLTITFMSIQRCFVIADPLKSKYKDKQLVVKSLGSIIFVSTTFAILITVLLKHTYKTVPLAICTPFVDPTNSISLIKIITYLIVITQFAATLFIIVAYSILFSNLKARQKLKLNENNKKENLFILAQIITVTLSNIICWVPSGIIYLHSTFVEKYSIDIVIWTTIFITPINSLINPAIFTIVTVKNLFLKSRTYN